MLKKILISVTEFVNNKSSAVKKFKKEYPDEEIKFASASTVLESKDGEPIGYSSKRWLQRRGVLILSNKRFYAFSSIFAPMSLLWLIMGLYFIYIGLMLGSFIWFIIAVFSIWNVIQRRPYKLNIPLGNLKDIKIGSLRSITGYQTSLITVIGKEKSYNFCTAEKFGFSKNDILKGDVG